MNCLQGMESFMKLSLSSILHSGISYHPRSYVPYWVDVCQEIKTVFDRLLPIKKNEAELQNQGI